MKEVLSYELTNYPLSIASPDGMLMKTAKCKLMQQLEEIPALPNHPMNCCIYDGMVLLQKLPNQLATFGHVSDYLLKKVTAHAHRVSFFVTDQYYQLSIKSLERKKRAGCGEIRLKPTRRDQKTPSQFKKFLANSQNKLDLVRFLIEDWSTNPCHIDAIGIREIYATIEEEAFLIQLYNGVPGKERVAALESSQEEADTKVFLCAQFATTLGINSITIITVDSDIGILALFYSLYLPSQIVLQLGSASTIRYLDISATTLSEELRRALPGFHAFTGCDSTSAFAGKGKIKCLKILATDERFLDAFALLGEQPNLNETVAEILEEFTCRIYGEKAFVLINEARYEVFRKKKAMPDPHMLPPSQDALKMHIARTNYQTYEWKNSLSQHNVRLDPNDHGWSITDEKVEIHWMNQKPAPEMLEELTSCSCRKSKCQNKMCKCKAAELLCTDLCGCIECQNNGSQDDNDELSDEDDEISDDEESDSESNIEWDWSDNDSTDEAPVEEE